MADPVVHFEIIGKNAPRLRSYYENLFGWKADTDSAVAPEVSAPGNYGFIDKVSTEDGPASPAVSAEEKNMLATRYSMSVSKM